MQIEQRAQLLLRGFLERTDLGPTRIVHQDIDAAVAGDHVGYHFQVTAGVGYVEFHRKNLVGVGGN